VFCSNIMVRPWRTSPIRQRGLSYSYRQPEDRSLLIIRFRQASRSGFHSEICTDESGFTPVMRLSTLIRRTNQLVYRLPRQHKMFHVKYFVRTFAGA